MQEKTNKNFELVKKEFGVIYANFINNIYNRTNILFAPWEGSTKIDNYDDIIEILNPSQEDLEDYVEFSNNLIFYFRYGRDFIRFGMKQFPGLCGAIIVYNFNLPHYSLDRKTIDIIIEEILSFAENVATILEFTIVMYSHNELNYISTGKKVGYKEVYKFKNYRSDNDVTILEKNLIDTED